MTEKTSGPEMFMKGFKAGLVTAEKFVRNQIDDIPSGGGHIAHYQQAFDERHTEAEKLLGSIIDLQKELEASS